VTGDLLAALGGHFGWLDWVVVAAYFALTTWIGHTLAGKQATIHDFFLGGRKLPWYAVSGSIIATEISAVTFIGVPAIVYADGGNFTYLQHGVFGTLLARILVGYILVPAYYRREIFSPYDFMGNQLGDSARKTSTLLFSIGGILAQSARVYLTALILQVILHDELEWVAQVTGISPLATAVIVIGGVSIVWTLMGGISTVIWTDVILFLVFLTGAITAFVIVGLKLDGGFAEVFQAGAQADKFQFWNFEADLGEPFTFWAAMFASTLGGLGVYGTDQLLAQRMFCCKNAQAARWAIISSAASQVVTVTVMLVGVGLYAYYLNHPLGGEALAEVQENNDRIFPVFIMQVIPSGLKGLIVAGVFAAAISSLDSIMAALSQTLMSAFYLPRRQRYLTEQQTAHGNAAIDEAAEESRNVRVSRVFVLISGVGLCLMALLVDIVQQYYDGILNLALAMAGYASGGLLAGFALAFLPLRIDGSGYRWSGPLSVVCVFAAVWHQPWTHWACWIAAIVLLSLWLQSLTRSQRPFGATSVRKTLVLLAGIALALCLNYFAYWRGEPTDNGEPAIEVIAWPWYPIVGFTVAVVWGYLLAEPKQETPDEQA